MKTRYSSVAYIFSQYTSKSNPLNYLFSIKGNLMGKKQHCILIPESTSTVFQNSATMLKEWNSLKLWQKKICLLHYVTICSWNQPVLSNEDEVSCSRKQQLLWLQVWHVNHCGNATSCILWYLYENHYGKKAQNCSWIVVSLSWSALQRTATLPSTLSFLLSESYFSSGELTNTFSPTKVAQAPVGNECCPITNSIYSPKV